MKKSDIDFSNYEQVWQTWTLQKPSLLTEQEVPSEVYLKESLEYRTKMQMSRISNKMSIKDLADKIGYNAEFVAAFEAGEERITQDFKKKLESVLFSRSF
jgi:ribosome-binding protein aMBF1 (putative translation factor)